MLDTSVFAGLTPGAMSEAEFEDHIEYKANGWLKFDGRKFAKLQSGELDIGNGEFLVV